MKPAIVTSVSGTRRCCRARTRSRGRVVTANATATTTPVVPFRSRATAASRPFCDTVNGPSATCGPTATNGSRSANTTKGSSTASRGRRWRSGTRVLISTARATSSSPTRGSRCCGGTETTSSTKATKPTSLAWGGIRCSGVVPSTCRCADGPDPTSALAPRRAPPQDEDEDDHEQPGDGDAHETREATGQPGVAHTGDFVPGQG